MKHRWRNVIKDYLTFSAKERNGLIIIVVFAAAFFISSKLYTPRKPPVSKDAFQRELAQLQIFVDTSNANNKSHASENYADNSESSFNRQDHTNRKEPFQFDPNNLDESGWKQLGIQEKTIQTIQKFLASGFRFKRPEDLTRIYGLSYKDAKRLIPYIHISEAKRESLSVTPAATTTSTTFKHGVPAARIIDINTADTSAFIALPGIGSKLASRIVSFRQKLGGFTSVQQLSETYGLPDSTFQEIRPLLECLHPNVKTININTTSLEELRSHPYIRWNIANAIINYRRHHGDYRSVEDLKKIDIITEELFSKISTYLVI